jgi:threonine dehydrogenase-like Zn-dependent dehydrogenase
MTTVLVGAGQVEHRAYPVADPPPGGILLEMIRANVCGSEVHIVRGGHPLIRPGCVLGHEGVGRVARLGRGVTVDSAGAPLQEGDRVVATYFGACRHCPECARGDVELCRHAYAWWSTAAAQAPHYFGTFGTHWCLTPEQSVFKVPDAVSSKAVSAANCALSEMVHALDRTGVRRGDRVLVLGAGGLGLCAAALASRSGAHVSVAEMAPARLVKARAFGAESTIDLSGAATGDERVDLLRSACDGGADVVIEVTGVPSAFVEAVRAVRAGGHVAGVGNITPGRVAELDPGAFTRTGATVSAVVRYPPSALARAIAFVEATPDLPWEELVDADFALADAADALAAAEARTVTRAGLLIAGS